ncbi:hypothetical protein H6P81_016396 [Aristolochia fimbriata]|uniref:SAC3/GANP/THP3 conserved domain-containing protein n=1 Tax=Aristolochia fimbriata TaxID=158543 RepID=A0AAV7E9H1_ARIFI|nr:hypothetical protein H6P81_016396 [Aristolochia fimbriata]
MQGESITSRLRQLPPLVFKSKELDFARSILRYLQAGNYVGFRTTAAESSNLQFCLIEPYINEDLMQGLITNIIETHICHGRVQALSFINHSGYKPYPHLLACISAILMMQESELESLCLACILQPETGEAGVKVLPTKQTSFCRPSEGFPHYTVSRVQSGSLPDSQIYRQALVGSHSDVEAILQGGYSTSLTTTLSWLLNRSFSPFTKPA